MVQLLVRPIKLQIEMLTGQIVIGPIYINLSLNCTYVRVQFLMRVTIRRNERCLPSQSSAEKPFHYKECHVTRYLTVST
jgi:hypothetical protein